MSEGELFEELPGAGRALFTTRAHGNLSSVGGEQTEHGAQARERLHELIGVQRLARGFQIHGTAVRLVGDLNSPELDVPADRADGQATALRGVAPMVLSADCLPVALGCVGAVAMVHAGWRGLAAGVLEEGVRALHELVPGKEIVAIVGPCAGACCYEVGPEVHAAFAGAHRHGDRVDLRAIAHERLLAAGAVEVRDVLACTICDERFFSYRREGERAGRQAGVAWLS
jgi:purine-nucleoside/S-methyl-5'-thioadenosine phosphorylase / adenosine deaminase